MGLAKSKQNDKTPTSWPKEDTTEGIWIPVQTEGSERDAEGWSMVQAPFDDKVARKWV